MRGSALLLVLFASAACSSETTNSGSGGVGSVCSPGATQACVGPGSCSGAQACASDGKAWGDCACGSSGGGGGSAGSGGGGGSGGSAGGSGASGGSGGTGGASPKAAYLFYSQNDKGRVTRIDAESGSVLLNGPELTCPLLGGDARSIAVDSSGVPRVSWQDSKKTGRVDVLDATTLALSGTSKTLTHASAPRAFAYARRSNDAVLLWGDFPGPFYRWALDANDGQTGTGDGVPMTAPGSGLFPVAATWDGDELHVLWSSGQPDGTLVKYGSVESSSSLPTLSAGLFYRSITVETGRVRVVVTDDANVAMVCTHTSLASIKVVPPASKGWGIDQCQDVALSGWRLRGYASEL